MWIVHLYVPNNPRFPVLNIFNTFLKHRHDILVLDDMPVEKISQERLY